jgi:prepilin-type processing-associated H-X9-DG protein
MPISFSCPHCGLETTVADQSAGQSEPCPRCGKRVTIPITRPRLQPASKLPTLIFVLAVVLVVAMLCPSTIVIFPTTARRAQCQNNLKQIGLALLNYEQANKCFPPAVFTDDRGKPTMSWRVAVLPYDELSSLYDAYDRKQSWDSPYNRALGKTSVESFHCPSDPDATANSTETNYVRIVGKDTIGGRPNEAVKISDITDGTSNTIIVVEVSGLHINWAEPRDVTVDEFMELVAKGRASHHSGGFQALFADGSVHFISNALDPKTLRSLLLRNDSQPVGNY